MKKYIILDRDGVINLESPHYIKSVDECHPIPGSFAAIAKLNHAGYTVLVATNQSGVSRGYYTTDTLHAIHDKLVAGVAAEGGHIEEFFYCPHHPEDNCKCRKPKTGLFLQIQKKHAVDLCKCFYIGDSYTDIQVARAVGCKPVLVLTGNGEKTLAENPTDLADVPYFSDLGTAVNFIVNEHS